MLKKNKIDAKRHLDKLRKIYSQKESTFEDMTKEEIVNKLRKTRDEIWEDKLAPRS